MKVKLIKSSKEDMKTIWLMQKEAFGYNQKVYLVNGLFSTWEEMIQYRKPPVLLTVTLLLWKDVIISDGMVSITNINFSKTYFSDFKEIYLNAKRNENIIKSL